MLLNSPWRLVKYNTEKKFLISRRIHWDNRIPTLFLQLIESFLHFSYIKADPTFQHRVSKWAAWLKALCLASCVTIAAHIRPVCGESCKVNREMIPRPLSVCHSPVINYFKFSATGNPSLEPRTSSYITFGIPDLTHHFKGARKKKNSQLSWQPLLKPQEVYRDFQGWGGCQPPKRKKYIQYLMG